MGEKFAPCLATLVPHLCEIISKDDGVLAFDSDDDEAGGHGFNLEGDDDDDGDFDDGDDGDALAAGGDDDDDDDDELEKELRGALSVRTASMNVKKAAVCALGNAAEYSGAAFAPHVQPTMECLRGAVEYIHYEIRSAAAIALQQVCAAAMAAAPPPAKWAKGSPSPINPDAQRVVDAAVQLLVERLINSDTAKSVVATACEAMKETIDGVGPAAILPVFDRLMDLLEKLIAGQSTCQQLLGGDADDQLRSLVAGARPAAGGDDEDDDDEEDDHDTVLMDNVADLVGTLAKACGGGLPVQRVDAIVQGFAKFAKPGRSSSERAMAIGVFAELAAELPPDHCAARHFANLWPLLLQGLGDRSPGVRRNAAYGTGVVAQHAPALAAPRYGEALAALGPVLSAPLPEACDDVGECATRDNACAALCRMLQGPPGALDPAAVLPGLLPLLPLRDDLTETPAVVRGLLALLERGDATALACAPELARVLAAALAADDAIDREKPEDARLAAQAQDAVRALAARCAPDQLQAVAARLPPEAQLFLNGNAGIG